MTYTPQQIERAKKSYNSMMRYRTLSDYHVETMGRMEAEKRMDYHNSIIDRIKAGDKALEREWKMFYLKEVVMSDQKEENRKAKINANKLATESVLQPIKDARKITAFGNWLNTTGNPFRKQHFSKKYTQEAVEAFLATI